MQCQSLRDAVVCVRQIVKHFNRNTDNSRDRRRADGEQCLAAGYRLPDDNARLRGDIQCRRCDDAQIIRRVQQTEMARRNAARRENRQIRQRRRRARCYRLRAQLFKNQLLAAGEVGRGDDRERHPRRNLPARIKEPPRRRALVRRRQKLQSPRRRLAGLQPRNQHRAVMRDRMRPFAGAAVGCRNRHQRRVAAEHLRRRAQHPANVRQGFNGDAAAGLQIKKHARHFAFNRHIRRTRAVGCDFGPITRKYVQSYRAVIVRLRAHRHPRRKHRRTGAV